MNYSIYKDARLVLVMTTLDDGYRGRIS